MGHSQAHHQPVFREQLIQGLLGLPDLQLRPLPQKGQGLLLLLLVQLQGGPSLRSLAPACSPAPPPNFNKRARGAISENRRDPQRTPVLAGTLPQFPVPWVFWASLTVSLSFLPPSLPPKAAAVNPAVPRFRASSAQLPGGKGCAPITSNRKGLKGHSGGGTHLQGLEEAQGLLLEV